MILYKYLLERSISEWASARTLRPLRKLGISIKELSRRVDIPYTTLYNMLNRDSERFDLNLLEQIAQSLDVSVGILMSSTVPSMERILCDHYPSRNEYRARHSSDDGFTNLQNADEDDPYNTEKNDRFPFDPGDKGTAPMRIRPAKSSWAGSHCAASAIHKGPSVWGWFAARVHLPAEAFQQQGCLSTESGAYELVLFK